MALTYLRFLLPVVRSGRRSAEEKADDALFGAREGVQKVEEKLDDNSQRGSRSNQNLPWFRRQFSKSFPRSIQTFDRRKPPLASDCDPLTERTER